MQDSSNGFDTPMLGLKRDEWLAKLEEIVDEEGYLQPLGQRHWACFYEEKPILLVTFESIQSIQNRNDTGQPLGFELVRELGWSHLCVLSDGDTWYRDPAVFAYFDRLADDGFFDEFERVVFYGAGPGGYAASVFSVTAPGATVVAIQPQATLDPSLVPWDTRYKEMRRVSFGNPYGYAPRLLEAAERAFVIYDPYETEDAIHAALMARDNTALLRTPHMGDNLEFHLAEMQVLFRILAKAGKGTLTPMAFFKLWRARRGYLPYLRTMRGKTLENGRDFLTALVCANVVRRMRAPKFQLTLDRLLQGGSKKAS